MTVHALSPVAASAICQDLHAQGVYVAVRIIDGVAHVSSAVGPFTAAEKDAACETFARYTDGYVWDRWPA